MNTPTSLETPQLVNETRAKAGIKAVGFDRRYLSSSDTRSTWMDQTGTFSHTGVSGSSASDRMTVASYGWQDWGENIGYTSGLLDDVKVQKLHDMHSSSPGRDADIVNDLFEEIGVGFKDGIINGDSRVRHSEQHGAH